MKQIWKFTLEGTTSEISMPKGAQILSVHNQNDKGCIWAMVDPKAEKEVRTFRIFGTGHEINHDDNIQINHIGTFLMTGGALVWHVFEVTKK